MDPNDVSKNSKKQEIAITNGKLQDRKQLRGMSLKSTGTGVTSMLWHLSDPPSELQALRRTRCSWRKAGLFVLVSHMWSENAS